MSSEFIKKTLLLQLRRNMTGSPGVKYNYRSIALVTACSKMFNCAY